MSCYLKDEMIFVVNSVSSHPLAVKSREAERMRSLVCRWYVFLLVVVVFISLVIEHCTFDGFSLSRYCRQLCSFRSFRTFICFHFFSPLR